jgi:hypothetical protein
MTAKKHMLVFSTNVNSKKQDNNFQPQERKVRQGKLTVLKRSHLYEPSLEYLEHVSKFKR